MSLEANRFRLGVFFFLGAVLVIAVLVWLTGWFRATSTGTYVCYFSESVQGLENGTAVRYNGVPVGKVERIAVAPDGRLVEVVVTIESEFPVGADLAARLDFVGITGLRVVNLRTVAPGEVSPPDLTFKPSHAVIPVARSQLEKIDMGLQGLLQIMADVDFATISSRTVALLENLNRMLETGYAESLAVRTGRTAMRADSLIGEYQMLARRLIDLADEAAREAQPFAESLRMLADQVSSLTQSLVPVPASIEQVTEEGAMALRQLRLTLDQIRDHPERFFSSPSEDEWP